MLRTVRQGKIVIQYELSQTARKSVECRVAEGSVRVFAPEAMPLSEIDAFVLSRAEWICSAKLRAKTEMEQKRKKLAQDMQNGAIINIEGRAYFLLIQHAGRYGIWLEGSRIVVAGPAHTPETVRSELRDFLIERALARFEERVKHFSAVIGRQPGRITIREQKTKWGSCSGKGNLNFNWRLIMAPPQVLDYVVVHELCHMIELNHSPAFWALVEKYMPDYRIWQELLKKGIQSPV